MARLRDNDSALPIGDPTRALHPTALRILDHILTFMYFLYLFRKNILHLPSLFDYSKQGKYYLWAGLNPAGFIATGVGFALYYWLLNPVTYAQHYPFKWISASIPTIIVTGIVYALLTGFWIIPMRKGGYDLKKS